MFKAYCAVFGLNAPLTLAEIGEENAPRKVHQTEDDSVESISSERNVAAMTTPMKSPPALMLKNGPSSNDRDNEGKYVD